MVDTSKFTNALSRKTRLGLAGAALLAVGLAGGAGATKLTRPAVEMAPVMPVAISSLSSRSGPVTVKGKVAEIYGDRFTVIDASGKTMVDARDSDSMVQPGATLLIQGRYDDGQLRASFLVDGNGRIAPLGRPHPPRGPGARGPGGPGPDGPGGPDGARGPGRDGPPPPPANGCPAPPTANGAAPPPPVAAPSPAPAAK